MNVNLNEIDGIAVIAALGIGKVISKVFSKHAKVKRWIPHINSGLVGGVSAVVQATTLGIPIGTAILKGVSTGIMASGVFETWEAPRDLVKEKLKSD